MFEVGFSELLLIMALALIVLGPEKLPKVASQVGRWMGRARAMARQFRETLEEEVQLEETRKPRSAGGGAKGAGGADTGGGASAAATAGGSAAVAGGLAASEPPEPVFDTSNIPFSDAPQNPTFENPTFENPTYENPTYAPSYDSSAYSTGHGGGDAAPGTDSDADTRHNDYAGAAYEPPVDVSDAPAAPQADTNGHQPDVQRGN